MNQTVLVCGGRDYNDRKRVFAVLDAAHAANPIQLLVHGAARGADTLAETWANRSGVPSLPYPAPWKIQGRAAGVLRNQRMLNESKPDLVVAFPGNKGTADMVRRAEQAGVPVVKVTR